MDCWSEFKSVEKKSTRDLIRDTKINHTFVIWLLVLKRDINSASTSFLVENIEELTDELLLFGWREIFNQIRKSVRAVQIMTLWPRHPYRMCGEPRFFIKPRLLFDMREPLERGQFRGLLQLKNYLVHPEEKWAAYRMAICANYAIDDFVFTSGQVWNCDNNIFVNDLSFWKLDFFAFCVK